MYNKYLMELEDQYPELFEKYRKRYIEEGIEEGIKEGIKRSRIDIAKKMLSFGADMALIEECTELSKDELLSLKESL